MAYAAAHSRNPQRPLVCPVPRGFFGMDGESNGSGDEIVANGNLVAEVSQSRINDVD